MLPKPSTCSGCPLYEKPYGKHEGFSIPDGTGPILMVAEALGASEEEKGIPLCGKSGMYLFQQLQRVGISREEFTLFNVIACRPPDNKLTKMPYEDKAINHCSPNLERVISDTRQRAKDAGKHFVILTLGQTAFKRILDIKRDSPILDEDFTTYPFWSERYQAWVLETHHPAFLVRANHHLVPILQYTAKRAVEISNNGFTYEEPHYILDPLPQQFQQWVYDYKQAEAIDPENTFLSYDIETPYKAGKREDQITSAEDESYVILRCSFAYRENEAISVIWDAQYLPMIQELFAHTGIKFGWNSDEYDAPRIMAQMPVNGALIDAMIAWHVLNSAMPRGLGFVTPFYAKRFPMWKHLSGSEPALYNAIDALAALRCWLGIRRDLKANNQWEVFDRHVLKLNKVLTYMSRVGLRRDEEMRTEVEGKLTIMLKEVEQQMETVIPPEARTVDHVYKKTPKSTIGLLSRQNTRQVLHCVGCGIVKPPRSHFKVYKKKDNPCGGLQAKEREIQVIEYYRLRDWAPSKDQLLKYQQAKRQSPIKNREGKITFDENALKRLQKLYHNDPLYKLIGRQRYLQKLLTSYIGVTQEDGTIRGGMPMGADGFGHPNFQHNPKTLRLSCPFFHTLPRPGKPDDPHTWIRNIILARDGNIFHARDFSGIEAVLVGYEAKSPRYIRLAKMDVHSYYTAYALYELDQRISANDLPLISWDDDKLSRRLAEIKKEFKQDRNELYKHLTHAINFGQGPKGAQEKIYKETEILQPLDKITRVMSVYKELFTEIPKWHNEVRLQADSDGYLRNAFGYVLRFSRVFAWHMENGQWVRKLGDEAEEVLAFKPQSNAAGIIKEAMLRLYFDRFEEAGQYLRLQVHDELLMEIEEDKREMVDSVLKEEMERPIIQMPLPTSYGMGPYLSIGTEEKFGVRWGLMR